MTTTEQEQARLRQDLEQNARWNLVLLVTFVLFTAGFLAYQYWEFRRLTQPENLVALAEEKIKERYPEVRADLRAELVEAAPELAERLSRQAVASVPEAREELVQFLGRQLAVGLDEATAFSAEEFRDILNENRDLVLAAVEELKEFPEEAREFIVQLEKRLERRWDADFQAQARFVVNTLRGFNHKLERLSANKSLSAEDLLARRIVRILRAMQEERQAQ